MSRKITRRDFLNGTQVAIGASLFPSLVGCAPKTVDNPFALAKDYYPPAKTGLRGSHNGSWEVMHARVMGENYAAGPVEETFDLVVVGGGISGLSAAFFFRQANPDARILVLDNHDDFGGHAKRNEFDHQGQTRIGYGGTEAIDTPSHYTPEARQMLFDIGVRTEAFYDYFDQELYPNLGMSKAIMFDKEQFGEDKLVTGYGQKSWEDFAAEAPFTDKARADFIRVQTSTEDYLPGKTMDEKIAILSKTSYEDYLRDYCKVDEQVIAIYKRWGMSFWCVGIDEVPTTSIQDYDGGMPGVEHTLVRTGYRNDEPYIFHFPDGNASVARLLVRALIPDALPGSTQEDVVTATLDYSALDRASHTAKIRLNATVVNTQNISDGAEVTYVRSGKTHKVSAGKVIMACYNAAIPYICSDVPEAQADALLQNPKVPLVYTKVLVPNWRAFADLKTDFVYYTGGFYKQVELAYPVSMGEYTAAQTPDDPMVLHMCHSPWVPDVKGPDQWRVGRQSILEMPFEGFEAHVKLQLNQALGATGFDADKDISAITVNRWPHGYAYSPDLIWEADYAREIDKPWVRGRQPVGNIHIANSDAGAKADTNTAISEAYRAVQEIMSG